jgi:flagellar biosynthesis activator protein FlaF
MNAAHLALSGYNASRSPIRTERSIEYDVFAKVTHALKTAITLGKPGFTALATALYDNRKLWTALASDVAVATNPLPRQLRAQIFYLAQFTEFHSRKVLAGDATADPLVEINTSIMRGLRNQTGAAT